MVKQYRKQKATVDINTVVFCILSMVFPIDISPAWSDCTVALSISEALHQSEKSFLKNKAFSSMIRKTKLIN